jgi:hypothetical protein
VTLNDRLVFLVEKMGLGVARGLAVAGLSAIIKLDVGVRCIMHNDLHLPEIRGRARSCTVPCRS